MRPACDRRGAYARPGADDERAGPGQACPGPEGRGPESRQHSLDSLDREHYAAITRRDRLDDVLEGIEAAARAGLSPIKVNTLVLRGMNEADLPDLVDYCLDRGIELRVIEQMPIGPVDTWDRQNILTADEILHIMGTRHTLDPAQREDPHSPAGRWIVDGDPTKRLGVIASVSDPFCNACDRYAPDVGWHGAFLPVFYGGNIAARSAARGWLRCADCRAMGRCHVGQAGRARPQH